MDIASSQTEIRFDLNSLARVAADSVGAGRCITIKKYPDGMFNKAYLMCMDDGQEVIAKVPNPNAGVPHFTTAILLTRLVWEARKILDTPAPCVYTWNSQAKSHPVGAEFIIMDKIKGVPLFQLSVTFLHYSSLYYTEDVQPPAGNHFVKDGKVVKDSKFAISPATGRDWCDAGRSNLDVKKGPFIGALIPKDTAITRPCLWHNNLHNNNVFVDPDNPAKITGIINWQSCYISPLFNHNPNPAFLSWDGLEPETLNLAPQPKLSGLSPEERSAAVHEYTLQNVFIRWRKLMHAKNPDLYRVVEFRRMAAYGLIFLAYQMFEYGEAHFQLLLVDLKDTWTDLPAISSNTPFPFDFSEADFKRIKLDSNGAVAGTDLVAEVKERMGDLWLDKGFIKHE
ncbi:hypothetical protein BJX76DRAFT_352887 [Aspergillus varians]